MENSKSDIFNQNSLDDLISDEKQNHDIKTITNKKNKKSLDKFSVIFKSNLDYIISISSICILFLVTLILNHDIPFGKTSMLFSDTYEQIVSLFDHIFNVFEGKSTLFFSNYFGKGFNIFSTIEYMYFNPFYLIVLIGGRSNTQLMFTFSILLMLLFNAIIFIWFTRKHFSNINPIYRIILSLLYVFSSFLNYNIAFISWLIYPALILLLIDRFINFLKTDKIASFICVMVWYVLSCFSVGISTSILLLIIMTGYIFLCCDKTQRHKKLTNLFVMFLSSAIICLIILFPAIMDYLGSSRSGSIFENLLVVSHFSLLSKLGLIFMDSMLVLFSIIYFFKCDRKDKFNKFLLFSIIILFLPVIFNSMMKILCLSSYQGFCGRFYFLNEALLFFIVLKFINEELIKQNEFSSNKTYKIIYFAVLSVAIIALILTAIFLLKSAGVAIKLPLYNGNDVTLATFLIFIALSAIIITTFIFNKFKKLSQNFIKLTFIVTISISLLLNYSIFSINAYSSFNKDISNFANSASVKGNYKIANSKSSHLYFNTVSENLRNPNLFTSLISEKTLNSHAMLGYYSVGAITLNSTSTLISDAMMGIKYYISENKLDRPYLVEIEHNDDYYLYDNILVNTSAFIVNSDLSFDESYNCLQVYETLQKSYGIEGELFTKADITYEKFIDNNGEEKYKIIYDSDYSGILYINTFLYYQEMQEEDTYEYYTDIISPEFLQDIGYVKAGESFKFNLSTPVMDKIVEKCKFYFLNYEIAEKLCKKISERQISFEYNKNGYTLKTNLLPDEKLIVTIPNIDGYKYYVNDTEIQIDETLGGLVSISNISGDITLQVKHTYPYAKTWIIFSLIMLILLVIVLVTYHFTRFKFIEKLIGKAMIIVCVALIILVYCFGILLALCDISYYYFFS